MKFEVAPLDSYAQRITMGLAWLGGLLVMPLFFAYLSNLRWDYLLIPTAFAVLLALFLMLAYAVQPVAYSLEKEHLVVRRRWAPALRVPLNQVVGVSLAPALSIVPQTGLRFAFNPGVFGYQGPFYLDPYGKTFFLATNRERLVAVARLSAHPLILSPAHPRAFVDTMLLQGRKQKGDGIDR